MTPRALPLLALLLAPALAGCVGARDDAETVPAGPCGLRVDAPPALHARDTANVTVTFRHCGAAPVAYDGGGCNGALSLDIVRRSAAYGPGSRAEPWIAGASDAAARAPRDCPPRFTAPNLGAGETVTLALRWNGTVAVLATPESGPRVERHEVAPAGSYALVARVKLANGTHLDAEARVDVLAPRTGSITVHKPFATLARGNATAANGGPTFVVVTTESDWSALWRGLGNGGTPPEVDFAESRVFAYVLGERRDACADVEVTDVRRDGDDTLLHVRERRVDDEACHGLVLNPFLAIAMPNDGTRVLVDHPLEVAPGRSLDGRIIAPPAGASPASTGYTVVENAEDWSRLWARLDAAGSAPPPVDFSRERVLVALLADARDGASVEILEARLAGGRVLVDFVTRDYGPTGADLGRRVDLVAIPAGAEPVYFHERSEGGA